MMNLRQPVNQRERVVSLRDVTVTYQGEQEPTVRDCCLDVYEGETVLMVGPSGSGKSTLAMTLAGIIPRSVEAVVSGQVQRSASTSSPGGIGYVFQDPDTQFCMLSVADELAFGLENLACPREEMPARIQEALSEVQLDVALTAAHATFSGGMKQRLAIASAMAMQSRLFVFDEPTANLDPAATRSVFEQIVQMRAVGRTLVIIEHKYEALLPFVDKVVEVTRDGRIAFVGRPDEWRNRSSLSAVTPSAKRPFAVSQATAQVPQLNSAPVLTVANARLDYGDKPVWADVSFALSGGEWVAIVGPNGAGKSSLLEVLAGLQNPTAGSVCLGGTPLAKIPRARRYEQIAYGFQNPEYQFLFERVGDEMAGCVIGDTVPGDVHDSLTEFGLKGLAAASPYALSQGQKRRLAVAVMMRQNHQLYLFDEPTYGQDPLSEAMILDRLQALRGAGKVVVTVTHDLDLVKRYATRVIVLAEGGILYDGDVSRLFTCEDVLARAHLLDDTKLAPASISAVASVASGQSGKPRGGFNLPSPEQITPRSVNPSPLAAIHPAVKLGTLLVISVLTLFAHDFPQALRMWVVPVVAAFGLGWCNPWRMAKRLWFIVLLYGVYIWTFAANAAIPSGYRHLDWLWFHISSYGMWQGILVALRTFATVVLAYVFMGTTDGTDFVVSLSQSLNITPKLSYGVMAGTSFIPRFQHELRTFRLARQVRGRSGWWLTRPVTYALPLLSQSIRLSERVAIAMEARGFYGPPAERARARTYFRLTPCRIWDWLFAGIALFAAIVLFVW